MLNFNRKQNKTKFCKAIILEQKNKKQKKEPSYTIGGSTNCTVTMEKCGGFLEN